MYIARLFGSAALTLLVPAFALAQESTDPRVEAKARVTERTRAAEQLEAMVGAVGVLRVGGGEGGTRGPGCIETEIKHCNFDFDAQTTGGLTVLQAGFVAHEIAAATYTLPADAFPIYVNTAEFLVGTRAHVVTQMRYTVMVWAGTPNNGTLVHQIQSMDPANPDFTAGVDIPDAILQPAPSSPPNAASVLQIQFSIPNTQAPEDRILIADPGNHKFSIGIRIDDQIGRADGSCAGPAPESTTVFPCSDTNGNSCVETIAQPGANWLNGLNCPGSSYPCPPGGGWSTFAALPCDFRCLLGDPTLTLCCRPSGDWVMRAKWEPQACLPPTGACCLADGSCVLVTQDGCSGLGGSYKGDDVPCGAGTCVGACCHRDDGSCSLTTHDACIAIDGIYRGDGSACANAQCPQPQGACCFGTGCFVTSPANCGVAGGEYLGNGSTCISGQCPRGACCFPDGHCESPVPFNDCVNSGGAFQGVNTACGTTSCPQPTGACCVPNGNCVSLTQAQCAIIPNSSWLGAFTACSGSQCPIGACCFPDGACTGGLTSGQCAAQGGAFQGVGVSCNNANCPQPNGACCLGNGACIAVTQADCAIIPNSAWAGPLTTCDSNNGNPQADVCEPPPSCPCDWNMADGLDSQDFFDFLDGFFNGDADFNGVDGTDSQDYFEFIDCFFTGCP